MVSIELVPPVLESSARTSWFYDPTDSENKLEKQESKTGYPYVSKWDPLD